MTTKLMGQGVQRTEDQRFLRGHGRYVDDVHVAPDTLHAAVLRSPHAHARIVDIDVEAVLDLEGVHVVWTYDDLADLSAPMGEPLPLLIPHPDLTHGRTQYALAKDEVNYMGEAIAFVVADDRYVAEDAVGLIKVSYEFLPPVVGIDAARAAERLVHDDVPGNVGARMEQNTGDVEAAIAAAPRRLELDLTIERSACTPMEGRGTVARWDADTNRLQVWSSTQTSTGVRAAVAVKLGLDLGQVDVITPDVGGGFGVKINHPWPEELLVPLAARALGRTVKFTEDRREHFISSAHERGQVQHIEVGFDDDGRILGLDVMFWHDHGAYTPYGLIVPIITSTQLLGPYKPAVYRVRFESLYTNTVMVTPYRGAGRPQGCYAMERTMDAIAAELGLDRAEVRANNFIQPDEFPFEQGLVFQDGRELTYDSGDYPASLEKIKALVGWDEFPAFQAEMAAEGRRVGIGLACYVEGTGVGPYEGAHVHIETSGKVKVATGLTTQGQGHATVFAQLVADELGCRFEDVEVVTGDTRRMPYAVGTFASRAAVMSGSAIHLAAKRAKEKVLRIAAEALEASEDDLEIVDGVVSVKGSPGSSIDLGTVSVLSNPLRYAFDEASKAATQFSVGDPGKPPVAEDDEPGLEGRDFYSPERATFASGMHAVIVETDPDTAEITILKYAVVHDCGTADQPDDRGGADPRRSCAGRRRRALRADGLRRVGPAAQRVVHGLPDALRHRGPRRHRHRPPRDALAAQPARHQGRRRGGGDPVGSGLRGRDRGRREDHHHGDADLALRPLPPAPGALMKISGANVVPYPVAQVWDAILDPRVLVRTIPGCERLETTGENSYAMTVTAGRRRDQGHLRRLVLALRPQGARVAGDAAAGCGCAGHGRCHRRRCVRGSRAPRARGSPTRPTRSSAAWSAGSGSGCWRRSRSGWPVSSSATSATRSARPAGGLAERERPAVSRPLQVSSPRRPSRPAGSATTS